MKNIIFIVFILFSVKSFSQQREFEMKEGDTTYIMKQYFFCFYLRGDKAEKIDSSALQKLQAEHLNHINKMADEEVICMAGPFGDDTEKRGILLFDVATKEEAEEWVKKDPMVIAGRLTYEIHPWWGAKGSKLK